MTTNKNGITIDIPKEFKEAKERAINGIEVDFLPVSKRVNTLIDNIYKESDKWVSDITKAVYLVEETKGESIILLELIRYETKGHSFFVELFNGDHVRGICTNLYYDNDINKIVFEAESYFGTIFKVTVSEIIWEPKWKVSNNKS